MKKIFQPVWKNASKKWKNPLHNMCSYLAMFPPALPNYFIQQFTEENDIVLDPFSGRGTTALEASILNRIPYTNDLNPLAYVLSKAKVNIPNFSDLVSRIDELSSEFEKNKDVINIINEPDDIKMLYDLEITLPQLCYLKYNLNTNSDIDNFILATLMGIMHGKHKKDGTSSFLSISMPNTFSMSPNYVRNYIKNNNLVKIKQNVFDLLKIRLNKIYPFQSDLRSGTAYNDNALNLTNYSELHKKVKLIVTSPPYLKIINYGKYNWIRLWLLDRNSIEVDDILRIDKAYRSSERYSLTDDLKLDQYLEFMRQLILGWESILAEDGIAVIVIGDVDLHNGKSINLAQLVWEHVKDHTNFHLQEIITDEINGNNKVTKIWGKQRKGDATKLDRLLIIKKGCNKLKANISRNIEKKFKEIYEVK